MQKYRKTFILALITMFAIFGTSKCFLPDSIKEVINRGFIANLESKKIAKIDMRQNYMFELAMMALCLFVTVNYFMGKSANQRVADLWVEKNKPVFSSQFSVVRKLALLRSRSGLTKRELTSLLECWIKKDRISSNFLRRGESMRLTVLSVWRLKRDK
jgi:hypothetical protein